MTKTEDKEGIIALIKMATDKDSPFRGMVQLDSLAKMPADEAIDLYNSMDGETQAALKELYGVGEAAK